MRQVRYLFFLTMMLALTLSGCSGGGSSGIQGGEQTTTSLGGVAAKGPISGGAVQVFALEADGSLGDLLVTAVTAEDGTYSVDVGTYSGNVLVEVSGGTYISEATGQETDNGILRAAVAEISGTVTVAVTPLTEIAVQLAGESLTTAGITSANTTVSALLGGASIITTLPADVTDAASANADAASQNYGLLLATVAKLVADETYADVDAVVAAVAEDLADNQLDTTGTAILSTLNEVIADPNINQIGLEVENVTIVDAITSLTEDPVAPPDRLQGTFRLAVMDKGFWQHAGGANDNILGAEATLTFNGAGECSIQFQGSEFEQAGNAVNVYDEDFSSTSCTYTLAESGAFNVIFTAMGESDSFSGWVSMDGNALLHGKILEDERADGTLYTVSLMTGVKTGTAMNAASLNGTYQLFSMESKFWENNSPPNVTKGLWGADIAMTFNGAGVCTLEYTGSEFEAAGNTVNVFNESGAADNCSYTVAANGALAITLSFEGETETLHGWASIDGNTIISGRASKEPRSDHWTYTVELLTGLKTGTAMNVASLDGTYQMFSVDSMFWKSNTPPGVSDGVWGAEVTLEFDGAGLCALQFVGGEFERVGNSVNTLLESGEADACTYTVTPDGAFSLGFSFDGEPETIGGWLGAGGNTLFFNGIEEDVRDDGAKYSVSLTTGVKTR